MVKGMCCYECFKWELQHRRVPSENMWLWNICWEIFMWNIAVTWTGVVCMFASCQPHLRPLSVSIVNLIRPQHVTSKIKVMEWALLKLLSFYIWVCLISSKTKKTLWSPCVPVAKWWMRTIKGDVSFDSAHQRTIVTATQPLASWNITALKSTL